MRTERRRDTAQVSQRPVCATNAVYARSHAGCRRRVVGAVMCRDAGVVGAKLSNGGRVPLRVLERAAVSNMAGISNRRHAGAGQLRRLFAAPDRVGRLLRAHLASHWSGARRPAMRPNRRPRSQRDLAGLLSEPWAPMEKSIRHSVRHRIPRARSATAPTIVVGPGCNPVRLVRDSPMAVPTPFSPTHPLGPVRLVRVRFARDPTSMSRMRNAGCRENRITHASVLRSI